MKNKQISVSDLLQKNSNIPLEKAKDFTTSNFWHYTTMESAEKIVEGLTFYCSSMSKCNDKIESRRHMDEADSLHIMCFCHSDSEQIPMWYLYSGIDGKGAAIKITPATMIKLIESIETVKTPRGKILHKGEDFELYYGWVYYAKHKMNRLGNEIVDSDNAGAVVNYKGTWYEIDDWQSFIKDNYFVKDYPWQYEKEFRIVIKNKTKVKYKKLIVQIPYVKIGIDVKAAPGVSDVEGKNIFICGKEKNILSSKLDIQWTFKE